MNQRVQVWLLSLCFSLPLFANHRPCPSNDPIHFEYNRESVKSRVLAMESIVPPKYTTAVEGYLKGYLQRNRAKSERILGRVLSFFPLFEQYLKDHDMPGDLKYLSVVESALVPTAVSRVGATGLWQFMPETGRQYGLKINRYVDERRDPHKSTEAAMKHLAKQFKRFKKWELALAAYNSGAGRVNRAIRYGRSKNFWRIQRYLPRETRNYVPAFIGATYLINNYQLHGLNPQYPKLDLQLTESIKVYAYLPFGKIMEITGLPRQIIQELNPTYKRGFIPSNQKGNYVTLPKRVMPALKDYLSAQRPDRKFGKSSNQEDEANALLTKSLGDSYAYAVYVVAEGDNLERLASLFDCSPYHLMAWNQLPDTTLEKGQELKVWYPKEIIRYRKAPRIEALPGIPLITFKKTGPNSSSQSSVSRKQDEYFLFHRLRRYESLADVAQLYPGTSFSEIMHLNGFSNDNLPVAGTMIKVSKR